MKLLTFNKAHEDRALIHEAITTCLNFGEDGPGGEWDKATECIKKLIKLSRENYHHRARGIHPENCIKQPPNPKHVCCNGCCE